MSKRKRGHQDRRIRIRSVRRDTPDLKKLAAAVIALALAQNEAAARTEHDGPRNTDTHAGDTDHQEDRDDHVHRDHDAVPQHDRGHPVHHVQHDRRKPRTPRDLRGQETIE